MGTGTFLLSSANAGCRSTLKNNELPWRFNDSLRK